jgi:ankyrin repeat protein
MLAMIFLSLYSAAFGSEALVEAAKKGDVAGVNRALEGKVDIDVRQNNATALMWAAHNGHDDVAKILVNKGADVNAKDNAGYTPVVYAALRPYRDTLFDDQTRR